MEKFFSIFHDLHFDISFADALFLMPKFASIIKSLLIDKDKLFELAKVPLNENCSAMLLKKLPKKLGDPSKFLIPCNFPRIDVCHALADLGSSINLMPLSIWKKLSLLELTSTQMTLDLADRSITLPKGVAEDVFVKVGKFYFPTDFVVVDFKANPRVGGISKSRIEVDTAKVDVIAKRPHPTTVKVLGQQKMKHFQPIHYASKTITEAQIHYTTTEKEMLAVVYAFEKFWPYPILSKSIVYTDHSALKYLLTKQDFKPRLLRWVLLLQEFDITIRDKKGSENLAADYLSRLENPHKDVSENKDINENFPLETLGSLSSGSTLWFADISNFYARNFIKKGLTSQQKKKFFKDVKHYFGMTLICFEFVRIKSFASVCMGKKILISSKLVMKDLPGAIMVPISSRRKYSWGSLKPVGQDLSPSPKFFRMERVVPTRWIASQCLKTLVFGVLSRFTRASHPLLAISLGKSNILDHYRLTFICFLYA
nr:reverse transcriptase domain-containing protein [Tanacetum cinerariifolium]